MPLEILEKENQRMKKFLLLLTGLMLMSSLALAANPCTVGPSGEKATIAAAIDSWCPGGSNYGATPPFIISIDPSVEYDEVLTLDPVRNTVSPKGNIKGNIIIQSSIVGTPVVIKLQYDARTAQTAGNRDGLWIYQERYNVTCKDLLFCQSVNGTPLIDDDLVKVDENNTPTATIDNTITFERCIFTDIYTSGTQKIPAVKSKADLLAKTYPADMTAFVSASNMGGGDRMLKFWGDATPIMERMNLMLKDCVFFTKNAQSVEAYAASTTETITIQDTLIANGSTSGQYILTARPYNSDTNVYVLGTLDPRQGDLTKCTALLCGSGHALYLSGGGAPPIGNATVRNVLVDLVTGNPTDPVRLYSGGAEGKLIEDTIFRVDGKPGNIVDYPLLKNSVWNRVTFHRPWTVALPANAFFYLGGSVDPYGIILNDCVISGANMAACSGSFDTGGFILNNCDIAMAGPDAITTIGSPPLQPITYNNCKYVDPQYLSYNRKLETFLDTSNVALANAGSDITGIGGGAHYRGPDASDNVENLFRSFGDCEGDIFIDSSDRAGTPNDVTMLDDQNPVRGVIGNAMYASQIAVGSRLEGLSAICVANFTASDQVFTMYYKFPPSTPSYPRFALKRNQTVTPPQEGTGDAARVLWTNPNFTCDNQWHLFTPVVSTLVWTPGDTASLFVNNYFPYCANFYLDEIVFDDPDAPPLRVEDWGLF